MKRSRRRDRKQFLPLFLIILLLTCILSSAVYAEEFQEANEDVLNTESVAMEAQPEDTEQGGSETMPAAPQEEPATEGSVQESGSEEDAAPECTEHIYENGVCTVCGYRCPHDFWDGEICNECGITCDHPLWAGGECKKCGIKCLHEEYDENHCCKKCGMMCEHTGDWNNGVCQECGYVCNHEGKIINGFCSLCWEPCPHRAYINGRCVDCGYPCMHASHDRNGICTTCGAPTTHQYVNNVCSVCGEVFTFTDEIYDLSMWEPVVYGGTIETLTYKSYEYTENDEPEEIQKQMNVYLPFGYNRNQKYNLFLMIPGTDMPFDSLLGKEHYYDDRTGNVYLKNLLDNMMLRGYMQPTIVVNLTYFTGMYSDHPMTIDRDSYHMSEEIRNIILPTLIKRYSLYANGTTTEQMQEARDHVAVFGTSYGAILINAGIVSRCKDIIGWFASSSGFWHNIDETIAAVNDNRNFPIRFYYFSSGENDRAREQTKQLYDYLMANTNTLVEGYNTCNILITGAGHDSKAYDTAIYNCLRIFFSQIDPVQADTRQETERENSRE